MSEKFARLREDKRYEVSFQFVYAFLHLCWIVFGALAFLYHAERGINAARNKNLVLPF